MSRSIHRPIMARFYFLLTLSFEIYLLTDVAQTRPFIKGRCIFIVVKSEKLIIVRSRVTLEWIFQKLKFRKVSIERGKSLIVKSNDRTRSKLISLNKIFFKLSKQPNDVSKHSVRNLRVRTALIKFNLPSEQKSVILPLYNYLIVRIDYAIYDCERLRDNFFHKRRSISNIFKISFYVYAPWRQISLKYQHEIKSYTLAPGTNNLLFTQQTG